MSHSMKLLDYFTQQSQLNCLNVWSPYVLYDPVPETQSHPHDPMEICLNSNHRKRGIGECGAEQPQIPTKLKVPIQ